VATSPALPAGLPLDAARWAQTPLGVHQVIVPLLAVIPQQTARIAAREAQLSQHSRNSDRPSSADPPHGQRIARRGVEGGTDR
jgi:hypothetical protein